MGNNFHTPYTSATTFIPEELNVPLAELDKAITSQRNAIIHCDGEITWDAGTGTLAWSDVLRLIFTTAAGVLVQNTVVAGGIILAAGEMAYMDANEADGTVISINKAALTTGAASTIDGVARFVLGYSNATGGFFPVWLPYSAGGGASPTTNPVDFPMYFPGTYTASQVLAKLKMVRAITLPASLTGSVGDAGTNPTAAAVISITQNGTGIGSVDIATSGAVTFTFAAEVVLAAGDLLRLVAPATPDTTLADVSVSLTGVR